MALPFSNVLATIAVVGAVFGVGYLALLLLLGLNATDREFLGAFRDMALRYLRRGVGGLGAREQGGPGR